jgi:hypothetical protein
MRNPADAAMPYLDMARQGYDPYVQQGQEAYGKLNPLFSQMGQDPAAYLEKLMGGYQQSPAYQKQFEEMSRAAGNTAAAGGMRGSLSDIQNEADISRSLMGQDMQQWLQNVLGIQGTGLQGLGNFYEKGYGATSDIGNILNSQGSLAFQGQAQKNKSMNDLISGLLSAVGTIGGGIFGGPVGGAAGGTLGKLLAGLGGSSGSSNAYQPFSATSPFGQRGWL